MFEPYRVTFAGHREIDHFCKVERILKTIISELLRTKDYVDFYVGNDGEFDMIATSVIRWARKTIRDDNSSLNLVLPYAKAGMEYTEKSFDSIIIPEELYNVHPKAAITKRNEWLVKNAELLIFYVMHNGGSAKMVKCATDNNVQCIEIANILENADKR